ncbi:MAG: aldo/keto reductase [Planctomycetes bacterium]|nr:aldo/keto reductase [Planctomycetota bacterium]
MQHLPLGVSNISASRVIFGAWAIGGWMWGGQDEAQAIASIHAALDAGINTIDTAPMYGMGRSEQIVGKALAGRRDKVVIATKCGMRWDLAKGKMFFRTDEDSVNNESGDYAVHIYNGPESIREEVERSLKRLNTDYIDLYQTHWQDPTTPLDQTLAELVKLRDEGKIRAFGPCNADMVQLHQYTLAGASTDQEKYSMLDRDPEAERLPYCREHNVAVLVYSPLSNGLLTGKVTADRKFAADDLRAQRPRFTVESRTKINDRLGRIAPIAKSHGLTLAQLVIAWTLAQPGLTHALIGARTIKQSQENAAAADVKLSEDELAAIDTAIEDLAEGIGSSGPPRQS